MYYSFLCQLLRTLLLSWCVRGIAVLRVLVSVLASVTGLTRSHVSARLWRSWPVLTFVPRHLRTFPYSPYLYPYLAHKDSSSLSNVFVSTTHSYVYVAFLITTSFSALYPGSCLLRDTTLDPISTYLAGLGLLVAEHAFLRLARVGTGAAGCR